MKQEQAGTGWCHQFMTVPWGSWRNMVGQHQNQRDKGAALQWCWGPARTGLEEPQELHGEGLWKSGVSRAETQANLTAACGRRADQSPQWAQKPAQPQEQLSVGPCSFQAWGWSTTHLGMAMEHKEHRPWQAHISLVVKRKHSCFPLSAVFG